MTCDACGNQNREGARYCDACGAPLGGTEAKPRRAKPPVALLVGTGALAVALLVGAFFIGRSTASATVEQPAPAADSPQVPAVDQREETWSGNYVDDNGLPCAFAFSELYGWQLISLMEQQKWTWDNDYNGWYNSAETGALFLEGPQGPLNEKAVSGLGPLGGDTPVVFSLGFSSDLHRSFDEAVRELLNITVVDTEISGNNVLAVVYGQASTEHAIAIMRETPDAGRSLILFNPRAIAEGMLDDQLHGSYGKTADEAFKALVGREPAQGR